MSGHSKWANIKRKKGANDAIRGKITTKIGREITIAVRMGGGDPTGNMRLKLALSKAKANNIPKDNINRAIQKGLGATEGSNYEEVLYEGYGPGGVAVMVDCLTDNKNRTVGEVRHAFTKAGGNLGTSGSVAFQFTERGVLFFEKVADEDAFMEVALDAGAADLEIDENGAEVLTDPADYAAVYDALVAAGYTPDESEVTMRADNLSPVSAEDADKVMRLIERLEELDDVQSVYTNADFPEDFAG